MKQPSGRLGIAVYLIYIAIIFATWFAVGADYNNLVGRDVIASSVVLPLALGAVFMVLAISWLGWWRPVMTEDRRGRPAWTMWAVLLVMIGLVAVLGSDTDWSAISATHLALLVLAGVLVGFNEEALTRGVLVVGFRGTATSEVRVWFLATALFGLMHLPNGFFGPGLGLGLLQTVFAFLGGCGFYLLRRVSGTILLPMLMHGIWDFSTFSHQASGLEPPPLTVVFQFGTYLVSLALVIVVLWHDRKERPANSGESPGSTRHADQLADREELS